MFDEPTTVSDCTAVYFYDYAVVNERTPIGCSLMSGCDRSTRKHSSADEEGAIINVAVLAWVFDIERSLYLIALLNLLL